MLFYHLYHNNVGTNTCYFITYIILEKEVKQLAKGKLEFRADRCKGCELCVSVCPKKILKLDEENVNKKGYHPVTCTNMDECIACASCALMCPDGIINVYAVE